MDSNRCSAALERIVAARETIRDEEIRQALALVELAENYHIDTEMLIPVLAEKTIDAPEGMPHISEFLSLELGAALGMSQRSALGLVIEILDLKYRHPQLWRAFCRGTIPRWHATQIVAMTYQLDLKATLWVDDHLAPHIGHIPIGRLRHLTRGLITQADPDQARRREDNAHLTRRVSIRPDDHGNSTLYAILAARDAHTLDNTITELAFAMGQAGDHRHLDQRRAAALALLADPATASSWLNGTTPTPHEKNTATRRRGRSIIHIHIAAETITDTTGGIVRIEGYGPLTTHTLPEYLKGSHTTINPVIDDRTPQTANSYEIPHRIREATHRRWPYEAFPYSPRTSRHLDLDHIHPYQHATNPEPDQTNTDNLAPQTRLVHRAKTARAWKLQTTTHPTELLWTSPLGHQYLVNPTGTTTIPHHPRRE